MARPRILTTQAGLLALALLAGAAVFGAQNAAETHASGLSLISEEQEQVLGRAAAAKIAAEYPSVADSTLRDYTSRVGKRLASRRGARGPEYRFHLVRMDDVLTLALPGGPIFVSAGVLAGVESESEFAGVLAHQMAHVLLHHGTRHLSGLGTMRITAAFTGDAERLDRLVDLGLGSRNNGPLLQYSPAEEREADGVAVRILAQAGFDPLAMAQFFERLPKQGDEGARFRAAHPNPGDRGAGIRAAVELLRPKKYDHSTGEFERSRERARESSGAGW